MRVATMTFKKSFLFKPKSHLQEFVIYLENHPQLNQIKSENSQIFYLHDIDTQIIAYTSGMILFTKNETLEQLIEDFFINVELDLPFIEQYRDFQETKSESIASLDSSKGVLPKSVYLSSWQLDEFLQNLVNEGFTNKLTDKKVLYELSRQNETIIVNTNQTVYTPNGSPSFSIILNKLTKIDLAGMQSAYYVDMYGFGKKIGPVVISAVKCDPQILLELQIKGVKHESIGRYNDIEKFSKLIERVVEEFQVHSINPETINDVSTFDAYTEMIEKNVSVFLDDIKMKDAPILFSDRVKYSEKTDVSHVYEKVSNHINLIIELGLGVASILSRAEFEWWKNKMQQKYQTKLLKKDIKRIQSTGDARWLVKQLFSGKT